MHMKNIGIIFRLITSGFLLLIFIGSCKADGSQSSDGAQIVEESESEVVELDEDFIEFYMQFHEDSLFQLDHVAFPLKNYESELEGMHWQREDWKMHHPFSDEAGMFNRDYTVLGKIVIEKIVDANGYFDMERRFARLSSGWNLIYFKVEHPNLEKQK